MNTLISSVCNIRKSGHFPALNVMRAFLLFITFSLASCNTKIEPEKIDEDPISNTDPDGNTEPGGNTDPGGNSDPGGNTDPGGNNNTDPETGDPDIPTSSRNADIIQIDRGHAHTLVLLSDNTLWGVGSNSHGQLILNPPITNASYVVDKLVKIADNVRFVKALESITLIIKKDDTLWGCGWNRLGELGLGHDRQVNNFTKIADNVRSVAGGFSEHMLFVKNDNTLWGAGRNFFHAIRDEGAGDMYDFVLTPVKMADDVKEAAGGMRYTLILKNDNTVWGRGTNEPGHLGIGKISKHESWVKIAEDGKRVIAGVHQSAIIKSDNSLWLAGTNYQDYFGYAGEGPLLAFKKTFDKVMDVTIGFSNTLVLLEDNKVWAGGYYIYNMEVGRSFVNIVDDVLQLGGYGGDRGVMQKKDKTLWQTVYLDVKEFTLVPISLPWKD